MDNPLQCDHTHHTQKPNVGAISCYVSMFLVLKKVILIIGHHVDCRRWSYGGSQLLYNIKLFNFGYYIAECLWSLLIYVGGQTVSILQTLNEYLDLAGSFVKLHLLASVLNQWTYIVRDSFSCCWISMNCEVYMCISALQSFS